MIADELKGLQKRGGTLQSVGAEVKDGSLVVAFDTARKTGAMLDGGIEPQPG